uniref:Uncharacterized protein n=1 Tax=uncultured marine virus TaxID=186617 RepID=A0A0F7L2R2_9VIRU|nr:hypothetical protein [uncultured marine virus]
MACAGRYVATCWVETCPVVIDINLFVGGRIPSNAELRISSGTAPLGTSWVPEALDRMRLGRVKKSCNVVSRRSSTDKTPRAGGLVHESAHPYRCVCDCRQNKIAAISHVMIRNNYRSDWNRVALDLLEVNRIFNRPKSINGLPLKANTCTRRIRRNLAPLNRAGVHTNTCTGIKFNCPSYEVPGV